MLHNTEIMTLRHILRTLYVQLESCYSIASWSRRTHFNLIENKSKNFFLNQ